MSVLLLIGLVLAGIIILGLLWLVSSYNTLVRLRALAQEAFSGMDVQLKRRYDLIPNLVATVKQYSIHEKTLFEDIARYRAAAISSGSIEGKIQAEQGLTGALKTLFAVAENYPELKANENFMHLQKELGNLEHEIQLSRRYYNGAVRNYTVSITTFPSALVAGIFNFAAMPYFEVNSSERENPSVKF